MQSWDTFCTEMQNLFPISQDAVPCSCPFLSLRVKHFPAFFALVLAKFTLAYVCQKDNIFSLLASFLHCPFFFCNRVGGGDFSPQPPTPPDVRVTYHGGSTKQGFLGSEAFRYFEKRQKSVFS